MPIIDIATRKLPSGLMAITAPALPGFVLFAETQADAEARLDRALQAFILDAGGDPAIAGLAAEPSWPADEARDEDI